MKYGVFLEIFYARKIILIFFRDFRNVLYFLFFSLKKEVFSLKSERITSVSDKNSSFLNLTQNSEVPDKPNKEHFRSHQLRYDYCDTSSSLNIKHEISGL